MTEICVVFFSNYFYCFSHDVSYKDSKNSTRLTLTFAQCLFATEKNITIIATDKNVEKIEILLARFLDLYSKNMLFLTPSAIKCLEYIELSDDFGRYRTYPSEIDFSKFMKVLKSSK
jgi:hypothetical protein